MHMSMSLMQSLYGCIVGLKTRIFNISLVSAVRPDRMRGGRNKFGPMYKYDRALRQQALRQRQLLISQGLYQPHDHDRPPPEFFNCPAGTPPDVKPDILQLTVPSGTLPVHEPSRTPVDVCSSHGEFYRHDDDPVRAAMTVSSVGSYPAAAPLPVSQYPYSSRQHRLSCDTDISMPLGDMTDVQTSPVTPLAGLSHMMNDVPNFVAGQPAVSSRLLLPQNFPLPRNFPAAVQSRAYASQPPCPPVPPYHSAIHPQEAFRHNPSMVPSSSFRAVVPESAAPPFTPYQPLQSSNATVSRENPAASRIPAMLSTGDIRPSTASLPSPVATYSGTVLRGSSSQVQLHNVYILCIV